MSLSIVAVCLAAVIGIYFSNNPLRYQGWFVTRRCINWLPLGMTYAFLYMGRYNLTVAKASFGERMTNEDFGWVFGAGTFVYAFSFLINGPLVDRFGGKFGIVIAAVGSAVANALLGLVTWLVVTGRSQINLLWTFAALYGLNMYFQSFGGVSIIKVKANWFHVRERGVFGAIFGTLISFGVYFAFDWGAAVITATKVQPAAPPSGIGRWLNTIFVGGTPTHDATWAVFLVPAAILVFWALLDVWLIKETPEDAGFPYLETHDASAGHMHEKYTAADLLKKVFLSPLMLMLCTIELAAGVLRNGIMQWYTVFSHDMEKTMPSAIKGAEAVSHNWGLWLMIFGIVGGFAGGLISDKVFQSRRAPPSAIFNCIMIMMASVMATSLFKSPVLVAFAALVIVACVTGVHSLTSGTAAADFGGRKATATCSGIVDGCVYLGSSIQSVLVGYLTQHHGWRWWPMVLIPAACLGAGIAFRLWSALPDATRKYIAQREAPMEESPVRA